MAISISPVTTDIEIVNMAAMLCGKNGVETVIPGDKFATDAAALYSQIVLAEFGSNRWHFARGNQQLSNLTTLSPSFDDWLYYYDKPAEMLMLTGLYPMVDYTIWNERILTKTNQTLTAKYIKSVPVNKWSEPFKMYIIHALADKLSVTTATSSSLVGKIQADKLEWESRALFADGQSVPGKPIRSNPYVNVRY